MQSLKAVVILGLSITAASCASTDSTSPDPERPEWANGTNWSGTVTMKTGTVITVSFHLETRIGNWFGNSKIWNVTPSSARIENKLTGAVGFPSGSASGDVVHLELLTRDLAIDGSAGCIEKGRSLWYAVNLRMADDGNLKGNLLLHCQGIAEIDSQPIVIRRVMAG